jgi:hypothetical protein
MGTQHSPASSVLSGPFSNYVFLLVVVDRRDEPWLRLFRWSIERPKIEAIRLGTASKHDALKGYAARGESADPASGSRPDPEVVAKPKRRTYTAEYKQRILEEAEAVAATRGGPHQ